MVLNHTLYCTVHYCEWRVKLTQRVSVSCLVTYYSTTPLIYIISAQRKNFGRDDKALKLLAACVISQWETSGLVYVCEHHNTWVLLWLYVIVWLYMRGFSCSVIALNIDKHISSMLIKEDSWRKEFLHYWRKGLRIAPLNICSQRNKIQDVSEILTEHNLHVLAISETHLDSTINSSLLSITGYNIYRQDRNANGGGVAVYIQSQIPVRVSKDLSSIGTEVIWLQVQLP